MTTELVENILRALHKESAMFDSDKMNLPKDLLPVSRVMVRALTCRNYNAEQMENLFGYVREVQNLWQSNANPKKSSHAGVYYLVLAYRELEAQKILGRDGRILRSRDFATSNKLNGFLCRPIGCGPIILQNTVEFRKLAGSSDSIKSCALKERS